MININNQQQTILKILFFMIFTFLKVHSEDVIIEDGETKYRNPFIYNITDTNFSEIVNEGENDIFRGFDTTFLYIVLFCGVTLYGIKFLITVISKQIKEEMNSDYMII